MTETLLSLSSTEDDLVTDKDGAIKKGLISQLENEITRLKGPENKNLPPETFAQANSLISAMEESIKVIEMTWAKYHLNDKQLH